MKVYELLRTLDQQKLIENEVKSYYHDFAGSPNILKIFGNKTLKEFDDILRQEATNQLDYLLSLTPPEDALDIYVFYDDQSNDSDCECFCTLTNDSNTERYSMEGLSNRAIINLNVEEDDEERIYAIIKRVFFETWFFWDGSALRDLM